MDVVRANVEKVGGSVDLESKLGMGTILRLRVPLTLAIVPALVVRSGDQSFALPQNALVELVYVPLRDAQTAIEKIGTSELYRLREGLLPLVWLDRLLELEHKPKAEQHGFYIAVVESEGRRFGLVVDDLMAPEEIVVKPLRRSARDWHVFGRDGSGQWSARADPGCRRSWSAGRSAANGRSGELRSDGRRSRTSAGTAGPWRGHAGSGCPDSDGPYSGSADRVGSIDGDLRTRGRTAHGDAAQPCGAN